MIHNRSRNTAWICGGRAPGPASCFKGPVAGSLVVQQGDARGIRAGVVCVEFWARL